MKDSRFQKYLLSKTAHKPKAPLKKKDIFKNPGNLSDQDSSGFPPGTTGVNHNNPGKKPGKETAGGKKTEPETITMDMPEVKDIPGQEHIKPPRFREMADVTISSADEEGEGLLDDINKEEDDDDIVDQTGNVSLSEKKLLAKTDRPVTEEQTDRQKLSLDKTDGTDLLNEESDPSDMGQDLDIPGTELDHEDEKTGEEDEENNAYSRPD